MSHNDYTASQRLSVNTFQSLIMAAMRKADNYNLELLKTAFPTVWNELEKRYNAPGGFLNQREFEIYDNLNKDE